MTPDLSQSTSDIAAWPALVAASPTVTVRLTGALDSSSLRERTLALRDLSESGGQGLTLDLREARYRDPDVVVGWLAGLDIYLTRAGQSLAVSGADTDIGRTMCEAGLGRLLAEPAN